MGKKLLSIGVAVVFGMSLITAFAFSQESKEASSSVAVRGEVKSIAEDGSSIIINDGKKDVTILTTKEFLEDSYLEVGDKVEITAESTPQGLKAIDYSYLSEDTATGEEEGMPKEEEMPIEGEE